MHITANPFKMLLTNAMNKKKQKTDNTKIMGLFIKFPNGIPLPQF